MGSSFPLASHLQDLRCIYPVDTRHTENSDHQIHKSQFFLHQQDPPFYVSQHRVLYWPGRAPDIVGSTYFASATETPLLPPCIFHIWWLILPCRSLPWFSNYIRIYSASHKCVYFVALEVCASPNDTNVAWPRHVWFNKLSPSNARMGWHSYCWQNWKTKCKMESPRSSHIQCSTLVWIEMLPKEWPSEVWFQQIFISISQHFGRQYCVTPGITCNSILSVLHGELNGESNVLTAESSHTGEWSTNCLSLDKD